MFAIYAGVRVREFCYKDLQKRIFAEMEGTAMSKGRLIPRRRGPPRCAV